MGAATLTNRGGDAEEVSSFSPENYLIHVIKRAVTNAQNLHISLKGVGEIILMSQRGEFFANTDTLPQICSVPVDQLEVSLLENNDVRAGKLVDNIGRNIDELLWFAGFYASDGRLMNGCYRDDVVQLHHWPNISRIPITPNTIRIASLLTRYPTSLVLAKHLLKVDMSELYQFYSAARCSGLARVLNRKPEEPVMKPHRNQALLGKLLNKIAGL